MTSSRASEKLSRWSSHFATSPTSRAFMVASPMLEMFDGFMVSGVREMASRLRTSSAVASVNPLKSAWPSSVTVVSASSNSQASDGPMRMRAVCIAVATAFSSVGSTSPRGSHPAMTRCR